MQSCGCVRRRCGLIGRRLWETHRFRWNQRNVRRTPCAPGSPGHRTLPRTPATESGTARRRGSERHEPACRSVAQRLGDEAAGTQTRRAVRSGASPVPITRRALATHTHKGPSPISGPLRGTVFPQESRSTVGIWAFPVDNPATFGGTRRMFPKALARSARQGIELSHALRQRSAGQLGDEGPNDTSRLAGAWRSGWVTRPLGPEWTSCRSGASPVPITRKGPCYSNTHGPFSISGCSLRDVPFRVFPARPGSCSDPGQLWESEHLLWTTRCRSVNNSATSGGTRRMSAKPLARPAREGIELLPRTPATESGTAPRQGSVRRKTGLPEDRRGGWVTKPPGPESRSSRPGASPVPVTRKALGTHTSEGLSPFLGMVG